MSTPQVSPPPPYVVLAALDATSMADLVLEQALRLAQGRLNVEFHLLHVPERFTRASLTERTFDLEDGRRHIDTYAARARAQTRASVIAHLVEHDPASAILQVAASIDADVVVVGSHDLRGPARWLLGSVAQKVAQRASCPVLVARAKDHFTGKAPEIEAPCADCLATQRASRGAKMWCARHSEKHPHGHLHFEMPEGFGAGSSLIQP